MDSFSPPSPLCPPPPSLSYGNLQHLFDFKIGIELKQIKEIIYMFLDFSWRSSSKDIFWQKVKDISIMWALYILPIVACTAYHYSRCVTLDYFKYYIYEF